MPIEVRVDVYDFMVSCCRTGKTELWVVSFMSDAALRLLGLPSMLRHAPEAGSWYRDLVSSQTHEMKG